MTTPDTRNKLLKEQAKDLASQANNGFTTVKRLVEAMEQTISIKELEDAGKDTEYLKAALLGAGYFLRSGHLIDEVLEGGDTQTDCSECGEPITAHDEDCGFG